MYIITIWYYLYFITACYIEHPEKKRDGALILMPREIRWVSPSVLIRCIYTCRRLKNLNYSYNIKYNTSFIFILKIILFLIYKVSKKKFSKIQVNNLACDK